jgi:hypothetical protein
VATSVRRTTPVGNCGLAGGEVPGEVPGDGLAAGWGVGDAPFFIWQDLLFDPASARCHAP